jgi:putative endonuclease
MELVSMLRHFTESSNGRTTAFGAVYSGSNPGSVARHNSAPCFAIKQNFAAARCRLVPEQTWFVIPQMKFYYVYVLHNHTKNYIYIGYSEDLKTRVSTHNTGRNLSTKAYIPLELIHYEAYKNMKDAKRRELYLKSNRGRTTLMTMLKEYFGEKVQT